MNNKAAKGTWAAAFTVGSVWFGTHVGGGFASGNQVVSYFAQYGMWAAVLPIIAMGILSLVMYTVMKSPIIRTPSRLCIRSPGWKSSSRFSTS